MNQVMRWAAHEPIALNQQAVLVIILLFFALVGFRRGVNRELLSLVGIVVGIWVVERIGPGLGAWVNRFYRLSRFALQGGLSSDDPAKAWEKAKDLPDLIRGDAAAGNLLFAVFITIIFIFLLIGQRSVATPKNRMLCVLGFVVGGINGFLVTSVVLPRIVTPDATMTIQIPTKAMVDSLANTTNIGLLAIFFIGTVIALGLYNASGKK